MKKYLPYIFVIISAVFFITDIFSKLYYSPDDTYIYLQYARNFAHGCGFSFNAGEPSYGITSPLWAVIASIPYLFSFEGYWFVKFIDLFFAVFSIYIFYRLAKLVLKGSEERKMLSMLAVSIFILNTWFIRWAFTGMETSLAVYMMLAVFYDYLKGRYNTAFLLIGFFYLIRPEAVVLFAVLIIHYFIKTKNVKGLLINCVLALLPVLPFLIYAKIAFGTLVPNTAIGKTSFNFGITVYYLQLKRILQTIALSSVIEIILSAGLIIYIAAKKKFDESLLFILWIAGLIALYLITDSDIISRYLLIMIPVFTLLAVKFVSNIKFNKYVMAVILFVIIAVQSQAVFFIYIKPHTDNFTKGIETSLKEIGMWINNSTPQNSKILVNDVGAIGYYSRRYLVDAGALVNHDLELNKNIMTTPLEEREVTYNLLKYTNADYVVQREKDSTGSNIQFQNKTLQFIFSKEFPGLGISDPTPKWYKVYKVEH
jgi:arabinofuranosyltransferase